MACKQRFRAPKCPVRTMDTRLVMTSDAVAQASKLQADYTTEQQVNILTACITNLNPDEDPMDYDYNADDEAPYTLNIQPDGYAFAHRPARAAAETAKAKILQIAIEDRYTWKQFLAEKTKIASAELTEQLRQRKKRWMTVSAEEVAQTKAKMADLQALNTTLQERARTADSALTSAKNDLKQLRATLRESQYAHSGCGASKADAEALSSAQKATIRKLQNELEVQKSHKSVCIAQKEQVDSSVPTAGKRRRTSEGLKTSDDSHISIDFSSRVDDVAVLRPTIDTQAGQIETLTSALKHSHEDEGRIRTERIQLGREKMDLESNLRQAIERHRTETEALTAKFAADLKALQDENAKMKQEARDAASIWNSFQ